MAQTCEMEWMRGRGASGAVLSASRCHRFVSSLGYRSKMNGQLQASGWLWPARSNKTGPPDFGPFWLVPLVICRRARVRGPQAADEVGPLGP